MVVRLNQPARQIRMPPRPSHTRQFHWRRTGNWLVLGLTYASMYMARYNFGFANKSLSETYGWSKAQVGAIISAATLVYGIAAIFNGPLADRFGGRRAMLAGPIRAAGFKPALRPCASPRLLGTRPPPLPHPA